MTLQTNEYQINHAGTPYESIEISKDAIEKWQMHYDKLSFREHNPALALSYGGMATLLSNLLIYFDRK